MQILGKRSKILLIAVAIVMLVAIGISFAAWDSMSTVKAASGNASTYANAKVGDIIKFGNYYQDGTKTGNKYNKQPITWIVVDKDERTGQLTLLSEKILAAGSYFGNYYNNASNSWAAHYDKDTTVAGISYNQAYVDSTVRAYLNNLERHDLGGDGFTSGIGYTPSKIDSTKTSGLLSSVGFSNQRYWTGLNYVNADKELVDAGNKGLIKRTDSDEIYYLRPINNAEYINRPATLGFLDEAFTDEEKSMIVPKVIAGYTGFRWPDLSHDMYLKSYVEGAVDKIWLPSATELNVMNGLDWNSQANDSWTNPSDESSSTVFEYFKNYSNYGFSSVAEAVKATRTEFAKNSFAMNYSIPVYNKGTTNINLDIHVMSNSSDNYWTRSPMSSWDHGTRTVLASGLFKANGTNNSNFGVRPALILSY